jgi:hypothetical protein
LIPLILSRLSLLSREPKAPRGRSSLLVGAVHLFAAHSETSIPKR